MKRSDLKELIRKNIIQELSTDSDISEYDFLSEKKKKEEPQPPPTDETEEDIEITTDEESATENSNEEILKTLEDLKDKVDDDKFDRLMNNAITYYTRNHVTKDEGPEAGEESLMENYELRRLQRIAGLIK